MQYQEHIEKPSKEDQKTAMESYHALTSMFKEISSSYPEIEIAETSQRIKIPINALHLLAKILKETSHGRPISLVPVATEITTQAAAEILGCSRPYLVKLLEKGEIEFTKVGKHRRIKYEDIIDYKKKLKSEQRRLLAEIMKSDEESGLYDS